MKRRRIIIILCALIMMNLMLCSCNGTYSMEKEDYIVLIADVSDAIGAKTTAPEISEWSVENVNFHHVETAPKSTEVKFNGIVYDGEYDASTVRMPMLSVSHRYKGDGVFFYVDDAGELVSLTFAREPQDTATVSEEYCREMAYSILSEYVDLDQYCLETDTSPIRSNYYYRYTYYREISGYKTSDRISITIDGNGNVVVFSRLATGSFDDIKEVTVDRARATSAVHAKLADVFPEGNTRYSHSIEDEVMLIRLNDGRCAFLYTANSEYRTSNEDGTIQATSFSTCFLLTTPVQEKNK